MKIVSVTARQSVHPSKRSPTLQSSSGLCVPQIEKEQQSTVGEVSQPLKVMALASRLAAQTTLYQVSQAQTAGWVKRNKKNRAGACSCTSWCRLHFRCCRNILDLVVNKHASRSLLGSSLAFVFVDCVTCAIYSRSLYATSQRHDLWQWCNGKAIEALAGRRPTARWVCLRKLVFVRLPLLP